MKIIIIIFSVVFAANCNEIPSQETATNCPTICPAIYAPVCGRSNFDGTLRNFSSICQFNAVNCQSKPGYDLYCKQACPPDFPVCAKKSDGTYKEFSSYSLFEAENQTSNAEYTWIRNGTCVEKKPAVKPAIRPVPKPMPVDQPTICLAEPYPTNEVTVADVPAVADAPA